MVLINTVTVEAINTALIALQRGQSITIGGEKGSTVNNINVTNNGTGSGTDVSPQLNALDKRVTEVEKAEEGLKTENEKQDIRITVLDEKVSGLEGLGIEDIEFEEGSRTLFIYLVNGDVLDVVIPDRPLSLTLNGTTLTLSSDGETLSNVELPFIPSSEKGVAGGVATLDSSGRIPYSQLPESAMEFLGQWDASTNTPHLADGTGTNGDFYIVSTGGTVNFGTVAEPRNITFYPNDRVVYEGDISKWFRLPAGSVSSVNGMSGDVVLNGTNVNYSDAADSPTLKDKIDSVETKADIQADWNTSCTTSLSYIKNKPTIPPSPVQSDWNVTDTTSLAYIKNKPTIPSTPTLVCCAKCVYLDSFTASADRPIMVACPRETTGYSDQGVSTVCPLTFNPATGVLTAACFCGTADCIAYSGITTNADYDMPLLCSHKVYWGCTCRLQFNPGTGVLTAKCFCGTASCAAHATYADNIGWSIVQDCCEILIKKGFDNLYFICFNGDAKQCNVYKAICNIVHECYGAIPSTGGSRWETGFIGYVIYDNSNGICNCFHDIGTINLTSDGKVTFYSNADSSIFSACSTCSSRVSGRLTRGFFVL